MNRRTFLTVLGGGTAVSAAVARNAAAAPAPSREFVSLADVLRSDAEDFMYRRWRVKWLGWITPVNQMVTVGRWVAIPHQPCYGDAYRYATTMGTVGKASSELDVINMTLEPGWPSPFQMACSVTSVAEREAVKRRARNALLDALAPSASLSTSKGW